MNLLYNLGKRTMLFIFAVLLTAPALAQQGYAVYDESTQTLIFRYGVPTEETYWATDNTGQIRPWGSIRANVKTVVFEPEFRETRPTSCRTWFASFSNLAEITGLEYLNTSNVTDMYNMFYDCSSLPSLDLSSFDTSNVSTMRAMFYGCSKLTSLDLSNFDTSKVTDMQNMFYGCSKLSSLDVSNFDTSNVTNMCDMFYDCSSLTSLDLTGFDTSKVTYMWRMFYGCSKLTSLDLSNFDTSNVTDMERMFYNCSKLSSLDLSNFDTSNVTHMEWMFYGCSSLPSLDLSSFDTSNVTYMQGMFSGCKKLPSLDVSNFDTSKVTNMHSMFDWCDSLSSLDLSNFDTSNVTDMGWMFNACSSLKSLDLTGFNTSKVKNMKNMFSGCFKLPSLDVSNFDTSKVTNMSCMFYNCSKLSSLDLSNFDTSNVTDIGSMFAGCSCLEKLDVSSFDTSKAVKMATMFVNCDSLKGITFGKKFTGRSTSSGHLSAQSFRGDRSLRYIDFYACDDIDMITSVDITNSSSEFWDIPSTTVIYLPHGSQTVTDVQNVVYSYNGDENDLRCPRYYSEDKVDIEFPYDFITHEAEYKRSTANEKGTVILPYAFTSNENVRAYTLDEEHTTAMWFESTETVPAHTPFVFRNLSGTSTADFTQTDASQNFGITVYATRDTELHPDGPYTASANLSGWTMKGYYVNQSVDSYSNLYYVQNDHFTRANGETLKFAPHRVTFHGAWAISPSGSPAGASSYEIKFIDNNTTAIEGIETEDTAETQAIFDTAGRKLSALKKGVNIIRLNNGTTKKVIIK